MTTGVRSSYVSSSLDNGYSNTQVSLVQLLFKKEKGVTI